MQTLSTYLVNNNINPLEYGFVIALAIFASMFRTWYDAQKKQKEDDDVTLRDSVFSTFRGIFAGLILIEIAQPALGTDDYNFIFGLLGGLLGNVLIDKSIHLGDTVITGLFGKFEKMIKAVFDSEELPQKKTNDVAQLVTEVVDHTTPIVSSPVIPENSILTIEKFKKMFPKADEDFCEALDKGFEKYGINTVNKAASFLANAAHECGDFTLLKESNRYSAARLMQVFPKYFKDLEDAKSYEYSDRIFDKTYGYRLGNTEPNDGSKYLGRGIFQLTGKYNYTKCSEALYQDHRLVENPELVANDEQACVDSALWYWNSRNIGDIADKDESQVQVRKLINGGSIGLEDVLNRYSRYKDILK